MRERKIPTLLGLFLIFLGLSISTLLLRMRTGFLSQAELSARPQKVLITNIRKDQFSISWLTDEETEGFITFGLDGSFGNIAFDKRESQTGEKGKFKTHYVTITGLKEGETYYFKIGSQGRLYGGNSSLSRHCKDFIEPLTDDPFKISFPKIGNSDTLRLTPISGLVSLDEKGEKPISGALVCVQFPGILPLTDITGSSGNFLLPLVSLLKQDFSPLKKLPDGTEEEIFVSGVGGEETYAKLNSNLDHPVPPLQLGRTYDFRKMIPIISPPHLSPTQTTSPSLELISPSGEIFDTLPTFRGRGKPGQLLDIRVESENEIFAQVKIDENGLWSWTPPVSLSPGEHVVTVSALDELGTLKKIVKKFTILAASPILPVTAGTPSAEISPTPTPFPTSTPTPPFVVIVTNTPPPKELLETANEFPLFLFLAIGIISITLGITMSFKRNV